MASEPLPAPVVRLLWDVDVATFDIDRDRNLIFERVMSRGTWEAMKWLRARFPREALAEFVRAHGARRLSPRDLAYWALVTDVPIDSVPGGARPRWAGA